MASDPTGKGLLLKADTIADAFKAEITQSLAQRPRTPKLVGILATSAAPSKFYAEFTKKQCLSLGFDFVLKEIGAAVNPELGEGDGVEEAIIEANEDDSVDGIMVRSVRCLSVQKPNGSDRFTIRYLVPSRFVSSVLIFRLVIDLTGGTGSLSATGKMKTLV